MQTLGICLTLFIFSAIAVLIDVILANLHYRTQHKDDDEQIDRDYFPE